MLKPKSIRELPTFIPAFQSASKHIIKIYSSYHGTLPHTQYAGLFYNSHSFPRGPMINKANRFKRPEYRKKRYPDRDPYSYQELRQVLIRNFYNSQAHERFAKLEFTGLHIDSRPSFRLRAPYYNQNFLAHFILRMLLEVFEVGEYWGYDPLSSDATQEAKDKAMEWFYAQDEQLLIDEAMASFSAYDENYDLEHETAMRKAVNKLVQWNQFGQGTKDISYIVNERNEYWTHNFCVSFYGPNYRFAVRDRWARLGGGWPTDPRRYPNTVHDPLNEEEIKKLQEFLLRYNKNIYRKKPKVVKEKVVKVKKVRVKKEKIKAKPKKRRVRIIYKSRINPSKKNWRMYDPPARFRTKSKVLPVEYLEDENDNN